MHTTPVIGISGCSAHKKSVRAMMKQIQRSGGKAVFLKNHGRPINRAVERDLANIDALIIMGNNLDIDPKTYIHRYGKNNPKCRTHPKTKSELACPKGTSRARYEEAALKKAIVWGMPVLGICGGMQRINVLLGGTLHQHLPDITGCNKHMQRIAPHTASMPIIIKDHSLLARIARDIRMTFAQNNSPARPKVVMENALHHQALDVIGASLKVSAVSNSLLPESGNSRYLAEAIEADPEGPLGRQFLLGVQWHPEFCASALSHKIIRHLRQAAEKFASVRGHIPSNRHKSGLLISRIGSIMTSYGLSHEQTKTSPTQAA